MDIAISASGIGKQYRLGRRSTNVSFREALIGLVKAPFAWRTGPDGAETFWALSDVSFDIQRGDVIGLIGRNGSGKSTLLKILSRITEPTTGSATVRGRVGSLLEVGTGFHPELTGRENVYVNGAILGMKRVDIARKFDEIVAFADLDRFVDTPVKHYSSGMQMRLAFSVAAHLEPEVLLVDEVLAVGDSAFQQKCTGKMNDIARQGRTIVLVSHDLTAVQVLCRRVIRLASGRVAGIGPAEEQVREYLAQTRSSGSDTQHPLSAGLTMTRFGFTPVPVASGSPTTFDIELHSTTATRIYELAVLVHDTLGRRVGIIDFRRPDGVYSVAPRAPLRLSARLTSLPLVEGEYRLGLSLRSNLEHDILYDLVTVAVATKPDLATVPYHAGIRGIVAFDYSIESTTTEHPDTLCAPSPTF
jgi:lipopolysaccharide transport system ATP-binding protein